MNMEIKNKKRLVLLFLVFTMIFVVSFTFSNKQVQAEDSASDLEDSMDSIEDKIEKEKKEKAKLEAELSKIQSSVYSTQSQIDKTKTLIKETENKIARMEDEVGSMVEKVDYQKRILENLMREVYIKKSEPVLSFAFFRGDFSKIFGDIDKYISVEERVVEASRELAEAKNRVEAEQEKIKNTKEDHEKLLAIKQAQKSDLLEEKAETQADIQSKEKTISQLQSKLGELRSRYSELLGKSVSTDDILEAAEFAAKAVGMNKSFLLGVLVQESNKGQNVGTCDYKESKMSDSRLEIFKDICDELDYDYKKMKVSCPPKSYKGTGGAMGVAQFMPDTWWGYKSRIASLTGHNPPDPWSLVDGVTAMASKLAKDGASSKKRFDEAKAYCIYLAGGNWGYYCFGSDKYKDSYENVNCWGSSIRNYGEKVLCLKDNYEQFYD